MGQPSLDILMKRADSRYTLVVVAAKRARELTDKENEGLIESGEKPVTVALQEIAENKIRYRVRKARG